MNYTVFDPLFSKPNTEFNRATLTLQ